MDITFYKYQGTGNDFIIIDNRKNVFPKKNIELINKLCDRRFGIGADGLILLENSTTSDFEMVYFNADGNLGTMCGNGGRCIVAFAHFLGIFNIKTTFKAIGKLYYATIDNNLVSLIMNNVNQIEIHDNHLFLDTGSPHHVTFVKNIDQINVKNKGKEIRYGNPYFKEGTNVNFVEQINSNTFKVRTYERGVEDETFSCGTGVTAVAIASHYSKKSKNNAIILQTLGGNLEVSFDSDNKNYNNIILKAPAIFVFKGSIKVK
ncbi:MAG: diaminopimelate epimerase [Flavobacteriaceae bacterium]|nr:diaminopimelate epimerase [Flavobacteriaceae bacterium]